MIHLIKQIILFLQCQNVLEINYLSCYSYHLGLAHFSFKAEVGLWGKSVLMSYFDMTSKLRMDFTCLKTENKKEKEEYARNSMWPTKPGIFSI